MKVLNFGHNISYKVLDRGLIEEIGPTGIVKAVGGLGSKASGIQTGQIGQYSLIMIIGTIVLLLYHSS